jgi:hypothetical protein
MIIKITHLRSIVLSLLFICLPSQVSPMQRSKRSKPDAANPLVQALDLLKRKLLTLARELAPKPAGPAKGAPSRRTDIPSATAHSTLQALPEPARDISDFAKTFVSDANSGEVLLRAFGSRYSERNQCAVTRYDYIVRTRRWRFSDEQLIEGTKATIQQLPSVHQNADCTLLEQYGKISAGACGWYSIYFAYVCAHTNYGSPVRVQWLTSREKFKEKSPQITDDIDSDQIETQLGKLSLNTMAFSVLTELSTHGEITSFGYNENDVVKNFKNKTINKIIIILPVDVAADISGHWVTLCGERAGDSIKFTVINSFNEDKRNLSTVTAWCQFLVQPLPRE